MQAELMSLYASRIDELLPSFSKIGAIKHDEGYGWTMKKRQ
jgi:hypothetical protein